MEIKKEWLEHAKVNEEKYSSMYDNSLQNNDEFWADQAQRVDWIKKFSKIKIFFSFQFFELIFSALVL